MCDNERLVDSNNDGLLQIQKQHNLVSVQLLYKYETLVTLILIVIIENLINSKPQHLATEYIKHVYTCT